MFNFKTILISIILLILLSGHSPYLPDLAYIIEGEAGQCQFDAKLAVAHMVQRGVEFNGYSTHRPSDESISVALRWFDYEDTSKGAWSWFDYHDREVGPNKDKVQEIISKKDEVNSFDCVHTEVKVYK